MNRYTGKNPEEDPVNILVTKIWEDADNQDNIRPGSILVSLLADGKTVTEATITAENLWTYEFTDLEKYNTAGKEIEYSVNEADVVGYSTVIDGFTITNSHTPAAAPTPDEPAGGAPAAAAAAPIKVLPPVLSLHAKNQIYTPPEFFIRIRRYPLLLPHKSLSFRYSAQFHFHRHHRIWWDHSLLIFSS